MFSSIFLQAAAGKSGPGAFTGHQTPGVILHTDRDVYIAGEWLWFTMHLAGPANHFNEGRLGYIVLRCQKNKLIQKGVLRVNGNNAYGNLYLDDTISTGFYQLVGFSDVTGNPGQIDYAFKQLMIVNRFEEDLQMPDQIAGGYAERENEPGISGYGSGSSSATNTLSLLSDKSEYRTREMIRILLEAGEGDEYPSWISLRVVQAEALLHFAGSETAVRGETFYKAYPQTAGTILPSGNGGLAVSGEVTSKTDGTPIAGVDLFLTSADSLIDLHHTTTDRDGSFRFILHNWQDKEEILISTADPDTHDIYLIKVFDMFDIETPFIPLEANINQNFVEYIRKSGIITSINKLFGIGFQNEISETAIPGPGRSMIYSKPAYTIVPDNFIPLKDFREITREIIPVWRIRERGAVLNSRLINSQTRQYFEGPPQLFLDGIHIPGLEDIIDIGSEEIEKIEIHNYPWRYGNREFSGIVSIISKDRFHNQVTGPDTHTVVRIPPLINPSSFSWPSHCSHENSDDPDFRQVLYWNPQILFSSPGESRAIQFRTGDLTGNFIIRAEGITSKGNTISEEINIRVE